MSTLRGTGVALVTPFTSAHEVDFVALQRLVRHVVDGGVDFLVILGTTGESATLSAAEQTAVIEAIIDANNGEIPYVIGAGGNHTAQVQAHIAELDQRYEAAAYLSVVPYYNKPSPEGLYQHFKAVASSTDRDIILYNVPGRTAINMAAETSLRLARDFQNITSIKEASGDLEQCMDLARQAPADFAVLSGDDSLILPQLSCGMSGIISVAANVIPAEFSAVVNAGLDGDFEQARAHHYQILELMRLLFKEGNPAGVKAALSARAICGPDVRLPLVAASEALSQEIAAALPQ